MSFEPTHYIRKTNSSLILSDELKVRTEDFLMLFGQVKSFRIFPDNGKGTAKNFTGDYQEIKADLRANNKAGNGVFFIPNSGGHHDDSIYRINSVFMDLDDQPISSIIDVVTETGLYPHAIVNSSQGDKYHVYWLVNDEFPTTSFKSIQKSFISNYGHDPHVINESRVMRLPGYFHHKKEPFLTRVILFNPDLPKYSEKEIIDGLNLTIQSGLPASIKKHDVVPNRSLPVNEGCRNYTLISYAGELERKNLSYDDIVERLLSANSKYNPPEDEHTVIKKADSIWKYRQTRLTALDELIENLKSATQPERIQIIQETENIDLLKLCEQTEPSKWFEVRNNLFKGCQRELRETMKKSNPQIALPSLNEIVEQLPGCSAGYPGDFEGFPIVDGYYYQMTGKGLGLFHYINENRQIEVCHTPIFITKRFVRDANDAFLEVTWLEKNHWKHITSSRGDFLNSKRIIDLADKNFPVGSINSKALAEYLQEFESTFIHLLPEQKISFQMGWHKNSFLLGNECISSDSTSIQFQSSDVGERIIANGINTRGDYNTWVDAVKSASSLPLPMISLYASLATPLIKILEISSFGIDFSGRTSTGKTTILRLAASVWGQPDESLKASMTKTWDSTNVSVERLCELMSDLPVILDDTKRSNTKYIGSKLYLITSGQGRGRGSKNGLRETQSWRTILISSGEASAVSYSNDAGIRARILTMRGLPFGNQPDSELVNQINLTLKNNYGHAGRMFIEWLLDNQSRWSEFKPRLNEIITGLSPSNGAESRLAEKAALIVLVGELAHEALQLPWKFRNPIKKIWSKIREEAKELDIHIRGARNLYEWAVSNPRRFYGSHIKNDHNEVISPSQGWAGKWDYNNDWKYIDFIPKFAREILKKDEFDYDSVIEGLKSSNLGSDHQIRIDKQKVRCIRITRKAMTDDLNPDDLMI